MAPLVAAALIGAGSSLVGGMMGNNAAAGDRAKSNAILDQMLGQYQNLQTPDVEALKVYLEQMQSQGDLTPEQEAVVGQLGTSQLGSISLDPAMRAKQMEALQAMSGVAKDGMSATDKSQLEELLRTSAAQTQAEQKRVLENRASRGMAGGGDELAAALGNTQSGANSRSAEALKIAAQAADRRLNATNTGANLAAAIESSDYNRAAQKATANDAIANFNASLKQGVEGRNTNTANAAQSTNLANKQSLANQNTALRNQQNTYNTNLAQQDFENKLKKLQGMSGVATGVSTNAANNANATAGAYSSAGSGIGSILSNVMMKK